MLKVKDTMKGLFLITLTLSSALAFDGFMMHPLHRLSRMEMTKTMMPETASMNKEDLLRSTMKMQSTQVTEMTLASHDDQTCFLRTVCAMGTLKKHDNVDHLSMAKGMFEFQRLLDEMVKEWESVDGHQGDLLPHIQKTRASFKVGETTLDLELCDKLFPCESASAKEVIEEALNEPKTTMKQVEELEEGQLDADGRNLRQGRATCSAAKNLCPGVSIGCSLCGIFLDSTCSVQCSMAGIYCGVSGYACAAKAATKAVREAAKKAVEATGDSPQGQGQLTEAQKKHKEFMHFMFGDLAQHMRQL